MRTSPLLLLWFSPCPLTTSPPPPRPFPDRLLLSLQRKQRLIERAQLVLDREDKAWFFERLSGEEADESTEPSAEDLACYRTVLEGWHRRGGDDTDDEGEHSTESKRLDVWTDSVLGDLSGATPLSVDCVEILSPDADASYLEEGIIPEKIAYYDQRLGMDKPVSVSRTGLIIGSALLKVWPEQARSLYKHQEQALAKGLAILSRDDGMNGFMLAHAMGLGKSRVALLLAQAMVNFTRKSERKAAVLLVCPAGVLLNWQREHARWEMDMKLELVQDRRELVPKTQLILRGGGLLLLTYDQLINLKKDLPDALKAFHMAIVDECHRLSNPCSERTIAWTSLATTRRVGLSGTPMINGMRAYMHAVEAIQPDLSFEVADQLLEATVDLDVNSRASRQFVHVFHQDTAFMIDRRDSTILAKSLKPLIQHTLLHSVPADVLEKCKAVVAKKGGIVADPLVESHLRESKLEILNALLDGYAKAGAPCAVFCRSPKLVNALGTTRGDATVITGSTSPAVRQQNVDTFQAGGCKNIYLSVQAGSEGINLTRATQVIISNPDWSATTDMQACARAWRYGQMEQVNVVRLVARQTQEMEKYATQMRKQSTACSVVDGGDKTLCLLSEDWRVSEEEQAAALDAASVAVRALVRSDPAKFTLAKHDELVMTASEKLSGEEELQAANEVNIMKNRCQRHLHVEGEKIRFKAGEHTYTFFSPDHPDGTTLYLPPRIPIVHKVVGRKVEFIYDTRSPSFFELYKSFHVRVGHKDCAPDGWKLLGAEADAGKGRRFGMVGDGVIPVESGELEALPAGAFVFQLRAVVGHVKREPTEWSSSSCLVRFE